MGIQRKWLLVCVVISSAVAKETEQVIERASEPLTSCGVVCNVCLSILPPLRFLRSLSSAETNWCLFLVRSVIGISLNLSKVP